MSSTKEIMHAVFTTSTPQRIMSIFPTRFGANEFGIDLDPDIDVKIERVEVIINRIK